MGNKMLITVKVGGGSVFMLPSTVSISLSSSCHSLAGETPGFGYLAVTSVQGGGWWPHLWW